eukprot:gb/GECH01008632.1/.p1 GENE.gb/GECH01008632.1/~~gb/GECH01008632.1/.p1  ORF type:complete len:159 (+),score=40.08 gb/GECH01008632.1/:1-477(+)
MDESQNVDGAFREKRRVRQKAPKIQEDEDEKVKVGIKREGWNENTSSKGFLSKFTSHKEQKNPKNKDVRPENETVDIIPSLDTEEEEAFVRKVAEVPEYHAKTRPLDSISNEMQLPLPHDEDVDLSVLTCELQPADQVIESDEHWDSRSLREALYQDM